LSSDELPAGQHRLRVDSDGFVPHERTIRLEPGNLSSYQVTLAATPAQRQREQQARSSRKKLGIVSGAIGAVLLGGGVGAYAWNSARYDDWRRNQADADASSRAASIQWGDDAAIGLLSVGGVLAVAGSWLFLSTD